MTDAEIKECIDGIDFSQMVTADDIFYMVARAILAAQLAAPVAKQEPALERFKECCGGELETPWERLKFFCSGAMNGQDWLDSEPFFDAVEAQLAAPVDMEPHREMTRAEYDAMKIAGWHLVCHNADSAGSTAIRHIAQLAAPVAGELKWYEKCTSPAYCAAHGKCECGIAYRRHRTAAPPAQGERQP